MGLDLLGEEIGLNFITLHGSGVVILCGVQVGELHHKFGILMEIALPADGTLRCIGGGNRSGRGNDLEANIALLLTVSGDR